MIIKTISNPWGAEPVNIKVRQDGNYLKQGHMTIAEKVDGQWLMSVPRAFGWKVIAEVKDD